MNSIRRFSISVALLCAGAGTVLAAAPAQAQPGAARAGGALALSVTPAAPGATSARSALLRCDADGGTHTAATAACDDLRAVAGDVAALTTTDGICTREYAPVTATAIGLWQGRPLSYRATFANECELLLATGSVFEF
jgi:hypothetical protein